MRWRFRSSLRSGAGRPGRVLFRLAKCVPFAIVLVGLGIELSPAHRMYTGPLLTATPALASLMMGPIGTLSAAVGALAVGIITTTVHHAWGGVQIYSNFVGLAVVSVASVTMSKVVRSRRQSELDQVRRIATAAQEVVLRPVPARLGPLRAASTYIAAEAGAQIGGDLYEAVQTRYGVRVIVGDVRGKGLPAVRAAAAVLGAFREAVHYEHDLAEVMNHCAAALRRDRALCGAADQDAPVEDFVTALAAQIPDDHVVQLVNRGHPPPLVLHRGEARALMPTSPMPPLGLEDFITGPPASIASYPFEPGDRLLLHTDGVIEARNLHNDFFPLPQAMEAVHPCGCAPSEFLGHLQDALLRHAEGHLDDDAAMVLVDRLGGDVDGTPPTPRSRPQRCPATGRAEAAGTTCRTDGTDAS